MKNAVIYARVSTSGQADDGTSLDTQTDACRRWAAMNDYEVVHAITDHVSGAKLDRPGLDEVRDMVERGDVQAVIIYKLDRLARETADTLILLREFKKHKVELKSATAQIEDTDEGRMMTTMLAAMAEYERSQIIERTRRGKKRHLETGHVLPPAGRSTYGYRFIVGEGRYEINEAEAEIVRLVFHLLVNKQISLHAICNYLNERSIPTPRGASHWRSTSIRHMLTNETYLGKYHYSGIEVAVPPIIAPGLIEIATERIKRNSELSIRNSKRRYLLTGFLRCAKCGNRYHGTVYGRKGPQEIILYGCNGRMSDRHADRADRCKCKWYNARLETLVWNRVVRLLEDPKLLMSNSLETSQIEQKQEEAALERLSIEEQAIRAQDARLLAAYMSEALNLVEFKKARGDAKERLDEIARQKERSEKRLEELGSLQLSDELVDWMHLISVQAGIEECSMETKRKIFETLKLEVIINHPDDPTRIILRGRITEQVLSYATEKVEQERIDAIIREHGIYAIPKQPRGADIVALAGLLELRTHSHDHARQWNVVVPR